jgi:hypothetical protein
MSTWKRRIHSILIQCKIITLLKVVIGKEKIYGGWGGYRGRYTAYLFRIMAKRMELIPDTSEVL